MLEDQDEYSIGLWFDLGVNGDRIGLLVVLAMGRFHRATLPEKPSFRLVE